MSVTSSDKYLIHLPFDPPSGFFEAAAQRFPQLHVIWEVAAIVDKKIESSDNLPDEIWEGVTMLSADVPPNPERVKNVRHVQLPSAGWDRWLGHPLFKDERVPFCSAGGVQTVQIAEWVIATWLYHAHQFSVYVDQQRDENWSMSFSTHPTTDSADLRMGIAGYGAIGRQVGRLAQALGMEVYAYTSTPRTTAASRKLKGYTVPGTGDPDGLIPRKWFSGDKDAFNDFLRQDLDVLVLSLPGGPATTGLIGRDQFQILSKKKTFLSNIARGPIVDTDALVEALNGGLIRGAAVDVAHPEPLPRGHALWKCPNFFATPHVSWQSLKMNSRVGDLILENLGRLDRGEPLVNHIDRRE